MKSYPHDVKKHGPWTRSDDLEITSDSADMHVFDPKPTSEISPGERPSGTTNGFYANRGCIASYLTMN